MNKENTEQTLNNKQNARTIVIILKHLTLTYIYRKKSICYQNHITITG